MYKLQFQEKKIYHLKIYLVYNLDLENWKLIKFKFIQFDPNNTLDTMINLNNTF